ncbi:hypothetical protein AVEN_105051-1 [Araneus ventricosus]|uniref:Endonuclease/exonuclease/phosphatase domain-containing protein n=1 Tax=Araneus ventricosus TaxID=182803 RepID=A0A4Y2RMB4_ARAVE|nr:hypothetical protein AVEN_105051-1 [Araneus ventricosus]
MVPLVSWNCRGIRTKLVDVKALVNSFHPVCVALQQTFLKPNAHLKLRGYNCVRKDIDTGISSGGVCLLTSNHYPSTTLNLHTSLQAVAVQVHIKTVVTVCCIYLPPNDAISRNDLNTLPTGSGSNILCPFTARSAADRPRHRLGFGLD